ncbi:MAG: hypothetical protein U1F57_08665 [bacterium]
MKSRRGGDVEGRRVIAPGAAGVDQVGQRRIQLQRHFTHHLHRRLQFFRALPFDFSAKRKAPTVAALLIISVESPGHFFGSEALLLLE